MSGSLLGRVLVRVIDREGVPSTLPYTFSRAWKGAGHETSEGAGGPVNLQFTHYIISLKT